MDSLSLSERVEQFFGSFKQASYKRGSLLIRTQEDPIGIFYIKKGKVKQYVISKKGEEPVVNIFSEKAFFPMTWGMNAGQNQYDFEAIEDVEVSIAPRADVMDFLNKNPDVVMDLLRRILNGLDGMLLRMSYLLSGGAYKRTVVEIVIAAKRFGKKLSPGETIRLHLKETSVANQAGLSRETVSRQISILKKKKLVTLEKSILSIPSLSALEQELLSDFDTI